MIKKLFSIFNIKTKIESLLLFILNIIISILDIISIGSIPIFLYYALEKDKLISKIPFEKAQSFIDEILKNNSDSENLFLTLSIIVLIFVIKNIFIFLVNIYQVYFGRKIKTVFTAKLFNIYIHNQYDFYLDEKPGNFIKNLDSVNILPSVMMMSLGIIKETTMIFGLLIVIAYTNFLLAIILTFVFLSLFLLHKLKIGKMLSKQGKKSYDYQQSRYTVINEIFGSIADIKLLNKENFFYKEFKSFIWRYETAIIITKIINAAVRPLIEILGILTMVTFIIYFSSIGKSPNEIIPTLSFLALSFIRVIPSVTTLTSYLSTFKFQEKQLDYLIDTFKNEEANHNRIKSIKIKKYSFENSLELKNIDFTFKGIKKKKRF